MKVLSIGNAAYDVTIPIDGFPTENKKSRTTYKTTESGGGSSSVAASLMARWGLDTTFIGTVGTDFYGQQIIKELKEDKIETKYMNIEPDITTTTSFILANQQNGSRTIVSSRTISGQLKDRPLDFVPDVIYSDGYESNMTKRLLEQYPESTSILDAGSYKPEFIELGPLVDYFICSNDFAQEYTNIEIDYNNLNTVVECYEKIYKIMQNNVIITLEEHGSFIKHNGKYLIVPSIKVDHVVDSTGAGDIFHGAFTYFIVNNYDYLRAVRLANISGALATQVLGAKHSIPTLEDVLKAELENDGH